MMKSLSGGFFTCFIYVIMLSGCVKTTHYEKCYSGDPLPPKNIARIIIAGGALENFNFQTRYISNNPNIGEQILIENLKNSNTVLVRIIGFALDAEPMTQASNFLKTTPATGSTSSFPVACIDVLPGKHRISLQVDRTFVSGWNDNAPAKSTQFMYITNPFEVREVDFDTTAGYVYYILWYKVGSGGDRIANETYAIQVFAKKYSAFQDGFLGGIIWNPPGTLITTAH